MEFCMAKKKHERTQQDRKAKNALRSWPDSSEKLWPPLPIKEQPARGRWLRAQPKSEKAVCPQLAQPGTKKLFTRPDGMWLFLTPGEFADIVCVESSSSIPNLNDKRSRYAHAHHSIVVRIGIEWLNEEISFKKGSKPRWKIAGTFPAGTNQVPKLPGQEELVLPVRHLRVLYALEATDYKNVIRNLVPAAHEFFCKQNALESYHAPKMQTFLLGMWLRHHFYTKK
jgi:hypothetical protein